MLKRKLLTVSLFIFLPGLSTISNLFAQPVSMETDQIISVNDEKIQKQWLEFNKNKKQFRQQETLYTLPVVFHIIHKNGTENVSDASVMEAFNRLNDAFANRGSFDRGSGVDTKIQFCMATKDPDGNFTTGITRTYADLLTVNAEVHQSLLESLIKWDREKYINIWVVGKAEKFVEYNRCNYPDFIAPGYAGGGMMVLSADILSRAIIHEMGHALGLSHTFQGWCVNNNCLTDGDGICDTPPEETITTNGGCSDPENSCHTDAQSGFATDQNDLKTNHMDYGDESCHHDFTQGQKEKMRLVIETQFPGFLTGQVCTNDCSVPAESEFTFPSVQEYSIGETVLFTNTSAGAAGNEWSVNNSIVATTANLNYTFPGQGWYKISLLVKPSPDEIKCRNKQVNWIRVYCSVKSRVKSDKRKARIGEPVHFSSIITDVLTMPSPIRYEWYFNDTLFGTSASFDYSFQKPGKKIFYLVTIRGNCRDTSLADLIYIKDLTDYKLNLDKVFCSGNKIKSVKFSVCNDGYFETPAGLPVTFYFANPTKGPSLKAGSTFYTPEAIGQYCCKDFEFELPGGFSGNLLYGVINDDNSKATPYNLATDFPVTKFFERDYTNNLDSLSIDKFSVSITPGDVSVQIGTGVNLTAVPSEPASVVWSSGNGEFACDTCVSTLFTPHRFTRVIAKATSEGGCVASDTIFVRILANGEVFIPSGFTPNNDGLNDYFFVLAGEVVTRVSGFQVFNRWGEAVFEKQNTLPNIPFLGWDGKIRGYPAALDTYVYLVTVEFINGSSKNYKGTVTLIR